LTADRQLLAKLKAAINQCRNGDVHALSGLEISTTELTTISALAKATGDAFTYGLVQQLIRSMDK
jgi:hypothetical protein